MPFSVRESPDLLRLARPSIRRPVTALLAWALVAGLLGVVGLGSSKDHAEVPGRHSGWPTTHAAADPADAKLSRPMPRPTEPLTAMEGPT